MKLLYTIVYTDNLDESVSFYRDVLNLRLLRQDELFASFDLEPGMLGIKVANDDNERPGGQCFIIAVPYIDHVYKTLEAKDVNICKKITTEDWGRNFAILDPDGSKIEFVGS